MNEELPGCGMVSSDQAAGRGVGGGVGGEQPQYVDDPQVFGLQPGQHCSQLLLLLLHRSQLFVKSMPQRSFATGVHQPFATGAVGVADAAAMVSSRPMISLILALA